MLASGALSGGAYVISNTVDWENTPAYQAGDNSARDKAYIVYQNANVPVGLVRVRRRGVTFP